MVISNLSKIAVSTARTVFILGVWAAASPAKAQVPQLISYQGRVIVGITDFSGTGQFAFALVNTDGTTTYWSNDGSSAGGSQPAAAVSLPVAKGLYSVLLGDTSLTHMTAVPASVFANTDVRLRVWFNDGVHGLQQLTPDQRIAAVGYALVAANVPNGAISSSQLAANAVQSANIAPGAVGSSQLATNLTLGGTVTLTNGNLSLPATTDNTAGVLEIGGTSFIQTYGSQNTYVGMGSGNFTSTGNGQNTALGYMSLNTITTGAQNVAIGNQALSLDTDGFGNVAIGDDAMYDNTHGIFNVGIGYGALLRNTTGNNNISMGFFSLNANQNGYGNVALGFSAMLTNISGYDNEAVGNQALNFNTTGYFNVANGSTALYNNTTGFSNVADGPGALYSNTVGSNNIAEGYEALFSNTSGTGNLAFGYQALFSSAGSANNTAVGPYALNAITTGTDNTALGYGAGQSLATGSYNIEIGDGVAGNAGDDRTIHLGSQGVQSQTFVAGIYGTTIPSPGVPVYVNNAGQLGTATSSRRFKHDIQKMGTASDVILALQPVTFKYKPELDPSSTPQFGLIAEEVAKIDPDLIVKDPNGQPYTVRYDAVNAMLLNEFQKQHEIVEKQQKEIDVLMTQVAELKHQDANRLAHH
jgi:trimeric autotransporter adhesin